MGNLSGAFGEFRDYAPITSYDETPDGYLVVYADRVARTGVQTYYGFESKYLSEVAKIIGKSDNDPIRIYRPESEVFSDNSVNGWAHVPVTINHPDDFVTPNNYNDYAVGEVSTEATVSADKKWFGLKLVVKKADAISDIKGGKYPETSGGYTSELEISSGQTADGLQYDAIQRNIKPNHLAFVPKGRAFSDAAMRGENGDNAPQPMKDKEPTMDFVKIMVGDKAVQVAVTDADTVTKMVADHAAKIAEKDEALGTLKAELADAVSKVLTDEQIEAKVTALADAKAKREAVKAHFGDEAVKDASDAEIAGMFKVMDAAVDDTARKVLGDRKIVDANPWAAFKKESK